MRRVLLLTLIFSVAAAPVALADGPLVTSAKRAAQELAKAEPMPGAAVSPHAAVSVAPGETALAEAATAATQDAGISTSGKMWLLVGVGAVLAGTMWAIDHGVEDRTFSSLGTREDGCTLFC